MNGFNNSQDCTWEAGLSWLEKKYPSANFNFGSSNVTGNSWVKVDGDLALKEERISQYGAKLCNEFSTQWEEENKK